ncbi:MAG TPA: N-acetyl-gamma-glutamyl-phosphate reductase, partial [Methanomassiliicoccales archaeon]|nr:N-acetyl-gamma-glutamyl-phosphate reductase [Methanomassiliicoccales archaeon]
MVKAAIIGGSGYTGGELARLLCRHPSITLQAVTSRQLAGTKV